MTFTLPDGARRTRSAVPGSLLSRLRTRLVTLLLVLGAMVGIVSAGVVGAGAAAAATSGPDAASAEAEQDKAAQDTAAKAQQEPVGVDVTLVSLAPQIAAPGDTLTLTARIHNRTDAAVDGATASFGVNWRLLRTRSEAQDWASSSPSALIAERVLPIEDLPTIAPGASTDVTFSLDVDDLRLGAEAQWGARKMSVTVSDDGERLDVLRTFLLWAPDEDVTPVGVSLVAPVVGPPVDVLDPGASDADLTDAVSADGRLGRLVASTADHPEIGWAVDPALVAAAQASATTATVDWASSLLAGASGRDVFALRPYDPDLSAYAHANVPLPPADVPLPGDPEAPRPGASWRTDLAWPADAVPDQATVQLAADSGADAVVVRDGLQPTERTSYTPTGLARVPTDTKDVDALVTDPVLTRLVDQTTRGFGVSAGTEDETPDAGADTADADAAGTKPGKDPVDPGPATLSEATQRLLAETSVIARERPSEARTVLVALPRDWSPEASALDAGLDALEAAPWVDLTPVSELLDADVPDVERAALPEDDEPGAGEMPSSEVASLHSMRDQVAAFAAVTADPLAVTGPLEPALVTPTAVAYRGAPTARTAAAEQAQKSATEVLGGISVVPGSSINLISASGELPVRVRNSLTQDITVQVVLSPDDRKLNVLEQPVTVVPAGSDSVVPVPVQAIGSGNVTVSVQLHSATGQDVGMPSSVVVRVRAAWESVGTAIIAAVLAVGLVAGIWRTIRRGRSPRRAAGAAVDQPAPAPGPPPPPPSSPSPAGER